MPSLLTLIERHRRVELRLPGSQRLAMTMHDVAGPGNIRFQNSHSLRQQRAARRRYGRERLDVVSSIHEADRAHAHRQGGNPRRHRTERNMKRPIEGSLRGQVEKWLAPEAAPVHVTAFGRTRFGGVRYVCVEALLRTGLRALYFFRHGDGSWRVYPPAAHAGAASQRRFTSSAPRRPNSTAHEARPQ
jgi:hypothetical protein